MSSGRLQEIKTNEKLLVAVSYERWPFTRGYNYRALTGKFGVLDRWLLMGGGCIWRFEFSCFYC